MLLAVKTEPRERTAGKRLWPKRAHTTALHILAQAVYDTPSGTDASDDSCNLPTLQPTEKGRRHLTL